MQTAELATVVAGEIERGLPPSQSHALPELIEHVAVEPYTHTLLTTYLQHGNGNLVLVEDVLFTCNTIAEKWEKKPHLSIVR